MRAAVKSFWQMVNAIRHDMMLFAACAAPVIVGFLFKFGVAFLENKLTDILGKTITFEAYYSLFDIALAVIAPVMFCFAAAMVVLEERDDKIAKYLFVTPLGKKGYLISRFLFTAVISMLITLGLVHFFSLSPLSLGKTVYLAVSGMMQGIIVSLMVVAFSSNKLEGMAVTKLSTLTAVGFIVPYIIKGRVKYILSIFPSFWIGETACNSDSVCVFMTFIVSVIWLLILYRIYKKTF